MKPYFLYLILIPACCLTDFALAQNTSLPKEEMIIILKNGKQIRNAKLWEIYPGRIEYEEHGNLHDLATEEISGMYSTDGRIYIIEEGKVTAKHKPGTTVAVPATVKTADTASALLKAFSEQKPVPKPKLITESSDDCYNSFLLGKKHALQRVRTNDPLWFCAGCAPIYPFNILLSNSDLSPAGYPMGVNQKCYAEGYASEKRKRQNERVMKGGVTAFLVTGILFTLLFLSAPGM